MADTCSTSRHPSEIVEMHILWRVWPLYGVFSPGLGAQDPDHRLVQAEVAGEHRRTAELVGFAGDIAHDAAGKPYELGGPSVLASNVGLHEPMIGILGA